MRWRIIVAYDGSGLHGWQHQPGVRTVQGELAAALERMNAGDGRTMGASRTDAGVHAVGQVAVFDALVDRPAKAWFHGLNRLLPEDVSIRRVDRVEDGFHPRRGGAGKTYHYHFWTHSWRHPLLTRRAARTGQPLDVDAMERAAAHLLGEHDFLSFRASGCDALSTVKTMHEMTFETLLDGRLRLRVRGTAFLKYMVRTLAGTLVEVGKGRRDPDWVAEVLGARDRRVAGPTMPPWGLTLMEVHFPDAAFGAFGEYWPLDGSVVDEA